ncbi:bifunctional protein GlmU-like [Clytia hemisphaerica]|uniref:PPC domain-containing protein n=1 Tax=Clytia hemisphaerica TaxID=252671 RepID=A0A7M5VEJ4_9CNID|eukprot:TCONS_00051028-protein
MENGFSSIRNNPSGGAIPKTGKSKFYTTELSFEDNFDPSNYIQKNTQHPTIKEDDSFTKPANPEPEKQKETINDISSHKVKQSGSPLMCYVVRLKHGDELRKSLLSFVKKNGLKAAFIMSCVGSCTSARVRLASATPENEANYMLDLINPMEIVSLDGTLSGGGHLHVGLADYSGKMMGGHLLELVVDTTAEVVIGDCSSLSFTRTYDQSTGFHELQVSDR